MGTEEEELAKALALSMDSQEPTPGRKADSDYADAGSDSEGLDNAGSEEGDDSEPPAAAAGAGIRAKVGHSLLTPCPFVQRQFTGVFLKR